MIIVACTKAATVVSVQQINLSDLPAVSAQYENVIDVTNFTNQPSIGWTFDGQNFVSPGATAYAKPSVKITKLALRNRFTLPEKVALQTALASSATLQAWYNDFQVAIYIDLKSDNTVSGITYLETVGLLSAGRASEILTTPPTQEELYNA